MWRAGYPLVYFPSLELKVFAFIHHFCCFFYISTFINLAIQVAIVPCFAISVPAPRNAGQPRFLFCFKEGP